MIYIDDYHDHYIRCETIKELKEFCSPLFLHKKNDKHWKKMWSLLQKCAKMFGCKNISVYSNDYMKYGDGIKEFLMGFWVNLKEADYNDEGSLDLDNCSVFFENGFMYLRI
jgi:hypothetical protein